MDLLEQIQKKINSLKMKMVDTKESDIIITTSPAFHALIEKEVKKRWGYTAQSVGCGELKYGGLNMNTLFDCEYRSDHYKNEIVIYDKLRAFQNPYLIELIP